jgi:hypothetical protein
MFHLELQTADYELLRGHLRGKIEQAAFLLADFDQEHGLFRVRELRLVPADGFDIQTSFHISLSDETRADLIKWAWDNDASLVELHSHGDRPPAYFSASDIHGFAEWVPHLFWRLTGRPYAAVVTAGETFDGLAWIDGPNHPVQLDRLLLDDGRSISATRLTLEPRSGEGEERSAHVEG